MNKQFIFYIQHQNNTLKTKKLTIQKTNQPPNKFSTFFGSIDVVR